MLLDTHLENMIFLGLMLQTRKRQTISVDYQYTPLTVTLFKVN